MGKAKLIDHLLIEKADVNYKYTGMSLEKKDENLGAVNRLMRIFY